MRHPCREAHRGAQGECDARAVEGTRGDHHPVGAPGRCPTIDPCRATAASREDELPAAIKNISRPGNELASGDLEGALLHGGPGAGPRTEGFHQRLLRPDRRCGDEGQDHSEKDPMDRTPTRMAEHGTEPVRGEDRLQQTLSDDEAVPMPQGPKRHSVLTGSGVILAGGWRGLRIRLLPARGSTLPSRHERCP